MVLSIFLSRQKTDDSNPHEIIPLSFSMREVLQENYYNLGNITENDKYLVQTRAQAKSSGVKGPEVHGKEKNLLMHIRPESQKPINPPTDKKPPIPKPRLGQGRAIIRRKAGVGLATQAPIQTPAPKTASSLPVPVIQSQERVQPEHNQLTGPTNVKQPIGPRIEYRPIPLYSDPILRLSPKPPDSNDTSNDLLDLDTERNINFEENSPYQEGIICEMYERLNKFYFKEPSELKDLIDTTKLVQKYLPKQTDIDKILDVIKRKVLKATHLPITIKENQAGYITSLYFKDLYLYLAQNKLPSKRSAIHKVETLAKRFILLDSLLFKLVTARKRDSAISST